MCSLDGDAVAIHKLGASDHLKITFHRTIRVPDNQTTSFLPPSMGTFPLYKVADYANELPNDMASKGGIFLPIYRESQATPFIETD